MDKYAVIGNPVSHSKSPFIHAEFAKQQKQDIVYTKLETPIGRFEETVKRFRDEGGKGLSVTLPFKKEASRIATQHSQLAEQAAAANTLAFRDNDEIFADNTDGPGLVQDLTNNYHYSLRQKKILILGAGGVVKCIAGPLLAQAPARLDVANRTPEKAIDIAKQFELCGEIDGMGLNDVDTSPYDLVINASSASVAGQVPNITKEIIGPNTWCYDLFYADKETAFLVWGKELGAEQCIDGLGMLVEQAAAQFYLWRGVYPDTKSVIAKLRS